MSKIGHDKTWHSEHDCFIFCSEALNILRMFYIIHVNIVCVSCMALYLLICITNPLTCLFKMLFPTDEPLFPLCVVYISVCVIRAIKRVFLFQIRYNCAWSLSTYLCWWGSVTSTDMFLESGYLANTNLSVWNKAKQEPLIGPLTTKDSIHVLLM